MLDPTSMSPGSIMPSYPWLFDSDIDTASTVAKIKAMTTLGVPYEKGYENIANKDLMAQAEMISSNLKKEGITVMSQHEIIALIAYMQRLGTDIKGEAKKEISSNQ